MERKAASFDRVSMVRATNNSLCYAEAALKTAENIRLDPNKAERIAKSQCKSCFYVLGRIGGAAMTQQPCACCGENQTYGSTNTDNLCLECAKKHQLCKHCGGDINLRAKRRNWPQ